MTNKRRRTKEKVKSGVGRKVKGRKEKKERKTN